MQKEILSQSDKTFILPQKTLIVFPDFIGDSVLLTAFLRNFRYNLKKGAVVHICANKNIADMIDGNPYVDAVFIKNHIHRISTFLKRQNYDAVIILDFSLKWSFNILKSNIKQKIITDMKRANLRIHGLLSSLFTHVLSTTGMKDKTPQTDVYLGYLRQLGLKIFDKHLEVKIDFNDIQSAKKLLKKTKKRKIFFHMEASLFSKKWLVEYWSELVNYLQKDEIYIIGTKNPPEILLKKNVINLCSKTTLKQTIALLYNADILITTDSSPAHLGAVAKVPDIIILYGPTNHHQWKPCSMHSNIHQLHANLSCNPCNLRLCKSLKCQKELKPQIVIDVLEKIKTAS